METRGIMTFEVFAAVMRVLM